MIRHALPKDASRLAEILIFAKRTAYRDIFRDDDGSFNGLQVLPLALEFQNNPRALDGVFVYDDGIVKGMLHWEKPEDFAQSSTAELHELYVDPFFQGAGIGSALLNYLFSEAKKQSVRKLTLWVLEKNARARAIYETHGFCFHGVTKLEPGYPVTLLQYSKGEFV